MHFKPFHFIFNINYYYGNFIKILYDADVPIGWQHFAHCRRDALFCCGLTVECAQLYWMDLLPDSGSSSAQLRSLHRKFRSSSASLRLYYSATSTTRHHVFHVSIPPCLLDRLVG